MKKFSLSFGQISSADITSRGEGVGTRHAGPRKHLYAVLTEAICFYGFARYPPKVLLFHLTTWGLLYFTGAGSLGAALFYNTWVSTGWWCMGGAAAQCHTASFMGHVILASLCSRPSQFYPDRLFRHQMRIMRESRYDFLLTISKIRSEFLVLSPSLVLCLSPVSAIKGTLRRPQLLCRPDARQLQPTLVSVPLSGEFLYVYLFIFLRKRKIISRYDFSS